jgi:hypothetical protein
MSLTRTRLITAAALMAVLVAGCGSEQIVARRAARPAAQPTAAQPTTARPAGPASAATPSKPAANIAGLSAQQIGKRTAAAAKAAVSVRIRGTLSLDDGRPMTLDASLTRTAGSATITIDGAGLKFVVIGRTVYVQVSDAFWRQYYKPRKEADVLIQLTRGKWLKVARTNQSFGQLATLASKTAFFDAAFGQGSLGRKAGTRTIGGIVCVGLGDPGDDIVWVDATNARPIRGDQRGRGRSGSMTFSEYNQVEAPKAPPKSQVIDGKILGL